MGRVDAAGVGGQAAMAPATGHAPGTTGSCSGRRPAAARAAGAGRAAGSAAAAPAAPAPPARVGPLPAQAQAARTARRAAPAATRPRGRGRVPGAGVSRWVSRWWWGEARECTVGTRVGATAERGPGRHGGCITRWTGVVGASSFAGRRASGLRRIFTSSKPRQGGLEKVLRGLPARQTLSAACRAGNIWHAIWTANAAAAHESGLS